MSTVYWPAVAVWVVLLALIPLVLYGEDRRRLRRRLKEEPFKERVRLTSEEFYETYYSDSGFSKCAVSQVQKLFSREVGIPAGYLRPEDNLSKLSVKGFWDGRLAVKASLEVTELDQSFGVRFGSGTQTLDDFIRLATLLEQLREHRKKRPS